MQEKNYEELISMILGLIIVVVVVGLIYNYFQQRRGSISVPGVTSVPAAIVTQVAETKTVPGTKTVTVAKTDGYVVKLGDNLWKIATNKYGDGFKWKEIAKINNIKNPRMLVIGQKLDLPATEIQATIGQEQDYKVQKADSLWKIAVVKYGDGFRWVDIWKLNRNKLRDPGKLEIGMSLRLPGTK